MFKMCCGDCGECWWVGNPRTCKCPDEEPKREWVGLTKKEKTLFSSWLDHKSDDEVFTAIEAKLKEKNK